MSKPSNEALLKKGVIVNTIGIITKSTKGLFFILISRMLGATEFGVYVYSFAIFELFNIFLQFGMGQRMAAIFGRYKLQQHENYIYKTGKYIFANSFLITSAFSILLYFIAPYFFYFFQINETYLSTFQVLCFGLPFYALKYNIILSIRASLDTRPEVLLLNMVEPIVLIIVSWVSLKINPHIETLTKAIIMAYSVMTVISFWVFRVKFRKADSKRDPKFSYFKFIKSCVPIVTMESINAILGKVDLLIIGFFVSPALVGLYGAALELGNIIAKIRTSIDPTLPSLIQKIHHEKDFGKMQSWFKKSMFWVFFFTLLATGCMTLDPDFFMSLFDFDMTYDKYFILVPMIAFGRVFHAVTGLVDAPLYILGHSRKSLNISIFNLVTTLLLFLILIPKYQVFGAGVGFVISAALTSVYRLFIAKRTLHITPINTSFLTPILCYAIALFITRPWHKSFKLPFKISNILSFIVFAIVYYGTYLLVLRFVNRWKSRHKFQIPNI